MLYEIVDPVKLGIVLLHGGGCILVMVIGVSAEYLAAANLIVGELRLLYGGEPNSSRDMSFLEA